MEQTIDTAKDTEKPRMNHNEVKSKILEMFEANRGKYIDTEMVLNYFHTQNLNVNDGMIKSSLSILKKQGKIEHISAYFMREQDKTEGIQGVQNENSNQ